MKAKGSVLYVEVEESYCPDIADYTRTGLTFQKIKLLSPLGYSI
jgi:hypothetical protein